MSPTDCILTFVATDEQWRAYHDLRRRILFKERGITGQYLDNHPDDKAPTNHPVLLEFDGLYIGAMRIDIHANIRRGIIRTVAIDMKYRRFGYGTMMLTLAEAYCKENGCNQTATVSADDAIEFYKKNGYIHSVWDHDLTDDYENQLIKRLA